MTTIAKSIEGTRWYIWSNEHNAWWKPDWKGYTPDKTSAGVYSYAEAIKIVEGANEHITDIDAPPNEAMILDNR